MRSNVSQSTNHPTIKTRSIAIPSKAARTPARAPSTLPCAPHPKQPRICSVRGNVTRDRSNRDPPQHYTSAHIFQILVKWNPTGFRDAALLRGISVFCSYCCRSSAVRPPRGAATVWTVHPRTWTAPGLSSQSDVAMNIHVQVFVGTETSSHLDKS